MLKRYAFALLRLFAFTGLLAALLLRVAGGDRSVDVLAFLVALPLWFGATLALGFVRPTEERTVRYRNVLYGMVDTYLVMMAAAAVAGAWRQPFILLGTYVFLAGALGGPAVGLVCAASGFLGLVNGWLQPSGALQLRNLLAGGGTALASMLCGAAWRSGIPLMARALRPPGSAPGSERPSASQLAEMETRLRQISEERDRAQERVNELEARSAEAAAKGPVADFITGVSNEPGNVSANDSELQATVRRLEAELAAMGVEKRKLMAEISEMSKELMAAYAQDSGAGPKKTEGDSPHAHG
jgi:hypothetical protein